MSPGAAFAQSRRRGAHPLVAASLALTFAGVLAVGAACRTTAPTPPSSPRGGARDHGQLGASQPTRPARGGFDVVQRGLGPFATRYDLRPPASLDTLGKAVLARLQAAAVKAGRAPLMVDAAAQRAAAEICRGLPAKGPPAAAVVEFAMRAYGLVEPPPHMVIADLPAAPASATLLEGFAEQFESVLKTAAYNRVGLGACTPLGTPGRQRLLVALLESRARFEPLPIAWRLGERRPLLLRVPPSHRQIHIVVAPPVGKVTSSALRSLGGGRYRGSFDCRSRGVFRIEVTGIGRYGSEVLANFPVYCGLQAPTEVRYEVSAGPLGSVAEIERDLARRTNALRVKAGLAPLGWRDGLAAVARAHSADMLRGGFVGHVSPSSGSAADRLRKASVLYLVARENVARAYSAAEAMSELLNSPAHRRNILGTDVTHIGVGVAIDRSGQTPVLLVTQSFIKPATPYNRATVGRDLLRLIHRARLAAGLRRLRVDGELNRLAAHYVNAVTQDGQTQAEADAQLAVALRKLSGAFRRVDGVLVRLTAIEQIAKAKELRGRSLSHIGFAVIKHQGQIVLFILLAS